MNDHHEPASIALCIPTFRRPDGLRRLLGSVATQQTRHKLRILVADNDAVAAEGRAAAEALKGDLSFELETMVVPERGVSHVRNALVAAALAHRDVTYVAMVDDDQTIERDWVEEMVAYALTYDAAAVNSALIYRDESTGAAIQHPMFGRFIAEEARIVPQLAGTGGVLINRNVLAEFGREPFDQFCNLRGGEDADFFARLRSRRGRMLVTGRTSATEWFKADRLTPAWFAQRAYRVGMSDTLIALRQRKYGLIAYHFITAAALTLLRSRPSRFGTWKSERQRLQRYRAAGKLDALRKRDFFEYA